MNREDVMRTFYELAFSRHPHRLPMRYGKDTLYVSPEAVPFVSIDLRLGTRVDPRLRDLEMRIESECR